MNFGKTAERWIKRNWVWILLPTLLVFLFDFVYLTAQNFINNYFYAIYIVSSILILMGTMIFIFKENPLSRLFVAYFFWWFGTDLIAWPVLVSTTGLVTTYGLANMSSDVFLYLSLSWIGLPPFVLYNLVYVIGASLFMFIGYKLSPKKGGQTHPQVVKM